jgi:hypothetical protein
MKTLLLAITLLLSFNAHAEWWDLNWTNPTEREDNTPYNHATEGLDTRIYNATDASVRATLPPSATSYEENFPPGCYGVALTSRDKDMRESSWTPLLEWCVLANPKPKTNATATRRVQ